MILRAYRDADADGCMAVFHDAVQIGAAQHYDQRQRDAWSPAAVAASPTRRDRLERAWTWVAEDGARLIGFMSLERDGHLDMAFVAPDHMGKGVAAALLARVEQDARDHGLTRLHTEASHLARRFFARHGWHVTAPETVYRDDVALLRFRMARDLTERQ